MLSSKQDKDTETLSSWQLCWCARGLFKTDPIYIQSQRGERYTEPYALQFELLAIAVSCVLTAEPTRIQWKTPKL